MLVFQDVACDSPRPYSVSVDAIQVLAEQETQETTNNATGIRGGGTGTKRFPCDATGTGTIPSSGGGTSNSFGRCGCAEQSGGTEAGGGYGGGCGSGIGGRCSVGGSMGRGYGSNVYGGGCGFNPNAPSPVNRSATFVKPSNMSDTGNNHHTRGSFPERGRARLHNSTSLASSHFQNSAKGLDVGKATKRNTRNGPASRGHPSHRSSQTTERNTARDVNIGEYTVSARRTPRQTTTYGVAGGLGFSHYHTGSGGGMLTSPMQRSDIAQQPTDPASQIGFTSRATISRRSSIGGSAAARQRCGVVAKSRNAAYKSGDEFERGDVEDNLDVRGQAAILYSKDGSPVGIIEGASSGRITQNASLSGSTGSEISSSSSDAHVEQRRRTYNKPEGFFLPLDSLVTPAPKTVTKKKKNTKSGTAFVITFNDSGIESASLGADDDDSSSSGVDFETTMPLENATYRANEPSDSVERSSFDRKCRESERYSGSGHEPNASNHYQNNKSPLSSRPLGVSVLAPIRSSHKEPTPSHGRRTPLRVKTFEGGFGTQPCGPERRSSRSGYLRDSITGSSPVSKVRSSYQAYRQSRLVPTLGLDTRRSVGANGRTQGLGHETQGRQAGSPLSDVSAYLRRFSRYRPSSSEERRLDTQAMKQVRVAPVALLMLTRQ